jgi:hypothetical protein
VPSPRPLGSKAKTQLRLSVQHSGNSRALLAAAIKDIDRRPDEAIEKIEDAIVLILLSENIQLRLVAGAIEDDEPA